MADDTVIEGKVTRDGNPVGAVPVRQLDSKGEFVAQVLTEASGKFRFFATEGTWIVRTVDGDELYDRRVETVDGQTAVLNVELPTEKPAAVATKRVVK